MPTRVRRPTAPAALPAVLSAVLCAVLSAVLAASASACGGDEPTAPATATVTETVTTTVTATPVEPEAPATVSGGHPYTGLDTERGPVLVVKVDNTRAAIPQEGVAAADLVYVEEVEGGLTRLAAVFSSTLPPRVGPVRSARSSDVHILGSLGPVGLAFSGANAGVLAELEASPLRLLGPDDGYTRDPGRRAPHDLFLDPAAVLARDPDPAPPRDIGLVFGEPAPGGTPASRAAYSWAATAIAVEWDPAPGRWAVTLDGRATTAAGDPPVAPSTVVFQSVTVRPSPYVDTSGAVSPEVVPVGSGEATVLRDGRAWTGTWERPDTEAPTRWTAAGGGPLTLAPGPVWIVLVGADQAPVVE